MLEVALAPAPALEAADRAARFKLGCKEVARRHGLLPTFMAKVRTQEQGSSGHIHQSLLIEGENAFWSGEQDRLSDIGRQYLGGLLATGVELSAVMAPNPNSYRRYDPAFWAPRTLTWGWDNRNACIRAITANPSATRLEHRRPGADLQPYLAIASCLAGGLYGIERQLEPTEPSRGRAESKDPRLAFPTTLKDAIEAFRSSAVAREAFGEPLVDLYTLSREAELNLWQQLCDAEVPEWELARYLETA